MPFPEEFVDEGVVTCFEYSLDEEETAAEETRLLSVVEVDCLRR